MMKRLAVAVASCFALTSCGGDAGNAAVGKTFTYGNPTSYSGSTATTAVTNTLALQAAPDATGAQAVAATSSITTSLLDSSALATAGAPAVQQRAFALAARLAADTLTPAASSPADALTGPVNGFDDPACVKLSASAVAFEGCTVTVKEVDSTTGATTMTAKVGLNGSVAFDAATGTTTWELRLSDVMTLSEQGQSIAISANLHESGKLTVTATTMQGQMLAEASLSASGGGQSASASVSEAVLVDLTYADAASCSTRVTGGTLEAKRVWSDRGGASAAQLPDRAALVTWTGCNQATAVFSWK